MNNWSHKRCIFQVSGNNLYAERKTENRYFHISETKKSANFVYFCPT